MSAKTQGQEQRTGDIQSPSEPKTQDNGNVLTVTAKAPTKLNHLPTQVKQDFTSFLNAHRSNTPLDQGRRIRLNSLIGSDWSSDSTEDFIDDFKVKVALKDGNPIPTGTTSKLTRGDKTKDIPRFMYLVSFTHNDTKYKFLASAPDLNEISRNEVLAIKGKGYGIRQDNGRVNFLSYEDGEWIDSEGVIYTMDDNGKWSDEYGPVTVESYDQFLFGISSEKQLESFGLDMSTITEGEEIKKD